MHCYNDTRTTNYHTQSRAKNNYAHTRQGLHNAHFSLIMLALYVMPFSTYYAQNYASIIGAGLPSFLQGRYTNIQSPIWFLEVVSD